MCYWPLDAHGMVGRDGLGDIQSLHFLVTMAQPMRPLFVTAPPGMTKPAGDPTILCEYRTISPLANCASLPADLEKPDP
jgi:hypothetical protein